ncbi:hypothetical protein CTEN210_12087 [Chaetoceros tenuissimus]|uniref:Uncharacterized protein n=1 Tax=Chaetoceros tenuissimus TaxID=426638 RepID=A0AAD3D2I7_9STRA|nr:hypothetical protein CTEN210_12087 [Chaetoceros tenuissimus]
MDGATLYNLCHERKWEEVRTYLSSNQDDNLTKTLYIKWQDQTKEGKCYNSLHKACSKSNVPLDIIDSMIKIGGKNLVMQTTLHGNSALHIACYNNVHVEIIKLLIKVGGKELVMKQDDDDGNTCLHDATEWSDTSEDVVRALLEFGGLALANVKNNEGKTAVENGNFMETIHGTLFNLQFMTINDEIMKEIMWSVKCGCCDKIAEKPSFLPVLEFPTCSKCTAMMTSQNEVPEIDPFASIIVEKVIPTMKDYQERITELEESVKHSSALLALSGKIRKEKEAELAVKENKITELEWHLKHKEESLRALTQEHNAVKKQNQELRIAIAKDYDIIKGQKAQRDQLLKQVDKMETVVHQLLRNNGQAKNTQSNHERDDISELTIPTTLKRRKLFHPSQHLSEGHESESPTRKIAAIGAPPTNDEIACRSKQSSDGGSVITPARQNNGNETEQLKHKISELETENEGLMSDLTKYLNLLQACRREVRQLKGSSSVSSH